MAMVDDDEGGGGQQEAVFDWKRISDNSIQSTFGAILTIMSQGPVSLRLKMS